MRIEALYIDSTLVPCSLFLVPCSLFLVPCSSNLVPRPCFPYLPRNGVNTI